MAKNKHNQPTANSNKAKKRKRKLRQAAIPLASLPRTLQQHIESLHLETVEDYLDWCRQNGFVCGIYKTMGQLQKERLHGSRARAEARVGDARGLRRPDRVLRQIVDGNLPHHDVPESLMPVQELLSTSTTSSGEPHAPRQRRALARRLIRHLLNVCPDILFERIGRGGAAEDVYLLAVLRLTEHPEHVIQDIETWQPQSYNARRRFASLARHLYGRFHIPAFMDGAWFDVEPHGADHRRWFVLVGAGKNIRTFGTLPIPLTRKMAHCFLQAPDDYTILEALRFGQIIGLGGDHRLADALRGTRLGVVFNESSESTAANPSNATNDHHDFWVSVLRFFIRHPTLDTVHVGPILDYLHHQRFECREAVDDNGRIHRQEPPRPNLSMRGRTPATLLRQVQNWHHRLGLGTGSHANVTWRATGIPEFRSVEGGAQGGNQRIWTIREITSGGQLQAEGRKMQHCVATYVHACSTGSTSIWSLEVENKKGPIRMLTIEVCPRMRRIEQARGRSNALPTALGKKVMARWATVAGLTIARWM